MTRQARLPLDLPPDLAPAEARPELGLSLGEAIEAFLRAGRGRGDRSYSPRTLREYRLRLLRFAAAVGAERSLRSIAAEDLRRFVADLARRESDYRLHDHLVTLKSFFGWALREGLVEEDPSARFMLPAAPERAIAVLSPQALGRLRAILRERPDPQLRAFAELAFCGLRRQELDALRWAHVDLAGGILRLSGMPRGMKDREIPLHREAVEALAQHRKAWEALAAAPDLAGRLRGAAFQRVREGRVFYLTARRLSQGLGVWAPAAGVPELGAEILRWTGAAAALALGETPEGIAARLGVGEDYFRAEVQAALEAAARKAGWIR